MAKLRDLVEDHEIKYAVKNCKTLKEAAKELSNIKNVKISPQILKYWVTKLNINEVVDPLNFAKTESQKQTAQVENSRLRKITKEVLQAERTKDDILKGIRDAVNNLPPKKEIVKPRKFKAKGKKLTAELLFSDLQIGKLMSDYNTEIAIKRMKEYAEVAIERIEQHISIGYKVERIVFAMIGDIIESDKNHPNSARATDTGTAEQLEKAIRYISSIIITPLARLGIPMDIVAVTGNHDHDDHGLIMFRPGKEQLSWPLYHALNMIHDAYGHKHLKWHIPEGAFTVQKIYGANVLYEHGVGTGATEASMASKVAKRSDQIKEYITLFRMGDKHNICRFNNDTLVVNGAFFGDDREGVDYSGICGYSGYPAQLMFFHTPRDSNRRTTLFDSLAIQLGHIT